MAYEAKLLADSVSPAGVRLTTMEVTFPRFVLAEFNTHRVFSRNSASSRAIPVAKLIDRVRNDPAKPVWWGQNQSGMSAAVELEGEARFEAERLWLEARDSALSYAGRLLDISGPQKGLHKQITNRILEPWMWQTVIVTATEWSNFYALRCDPNAQPEIRFVADMMRDLHSSHEPNQLEVGDWHLPLVFDEDKSQFGNAELLKLSAARCARVSYLTHAGKRDPKADFGLHDMLVSSGHMSPCEHPAQATNETKFNGNFRSWKQYRKTLQNESDFSLWL